MSNLIKSEEDIHRLRWLVKTLKSTDFSEKSVGLALTTLTIPMDNKPELLLDTGYFAYFNQRLEAICYNPCMMDRALDMLIKSLNSTTKDYTLLRSVLMVYVLGHELEHYNQYLVSEGAQHEKSKNIERAYKLVYGLSKDRTFLEKRFRNKHMDSIEKYNRNLSEYFVERNAQIEAYDMIITVLKSDYPELANEFDEIRNLYLKLGYQNDINGNVHDTLSDIGLLKEYHYRKEDLSFEDRVRYGLPISHEEQEKVLKLK